jgi:transcriptional regulator with GAF, ATPase, and Fis domain
MVASTDPSATEETPLATSQEPCRRGLVLLESNGRAPPSQRLVGDSAALREVLRQLKLVAATDATVLVQGETGTGKELIAKAIHDRSPRRDHAFVKLNVAAIPSTLLESELFGHERGAFTGALSRRVGRFEQAQSGTIFLDEIGELHPELQPKLLRLLQEREFQRLGGAETLSSNVRLISATNRDLRSLVRAGSFRADLYYRLSVFPLELPPLRARPEDIPSLAEHFLGELAKELGKPPPRLSTAALAKLERHAWPGNVRELRNVLERAMILADGSELDVELEEPVTGEPVPSPPTDELAAVARAHILRVLEDCHWVIAGPEGAAARLGVKRTTLHARLKKLGIARRR